MDRTILDPTQITDRGIAAEIAVCTGILQAAARYIFTRPQLERGSFLIPQAGDQPDHRVIVADPASLQVERPYMVGFYGTRLPDPDGSISHDLLQVDNRLIDSLAAFRVGLYNTAWHAGAYKNTAILPDRRASRRWAAENALHRAAVIKLAPRCYRQVLKFTGYVNGWPWDCRIELDEAILLQS